MVLYRRNRLAGGTYFFTVTLRDRKSALLTEQIDLLREAVQRTRLAKPFMIEAWVVLPEHMHTIWTLPPGDSDYSTRWRSIKGYFSHQLAKSTLIPGRNAKGEYDFWQRRFWEHTIRDESDFSRHVDYIHYNPVKHGYVQRVCDWPHSSFHRFVAKNIYPRDWGGGGNDLVGQYEYGE
ncbi:transposase [Methylobacter sp.]|uniref:REP-associated tyrosine transposase n=1 Tax=Methylobacter sp. TaxID=2051955 RepID=UPI0011FFB40B|nr:transposase [Methylobacter sp.]TAK64947.1 MAG: transposase [Methylobacter sp.]